MSDRRRPFLLRKVDSLAVEQTEDTRRWNRWHQRDSWRRRRRRRRENETKRNEKKNNETKQKTLAPRALGNRGRLSPRAHRGFPRDSRGLWAATSFAYHAWHVFRLVALATPQHFFSPTRRQITQVPSLKNSLENLWRQSEY